MKSLRWILAIALLAVGISHAHADLPRPDPRPQPNPPQPPQPKPFPDPDTDPNSGLRSAVVATAASLSVTLLGVWVIRKQLRCKVSTTSAATT